jgi:hypothetical protein
LEDTPWAKITNPAVNRIEVTISRVPTKHTAKIAKRRNVKFREYSSGLTLNSSTKCRDPTFNNRSIIPKKNLLSFRTVSIVYWKEIYLGPVIPVGVSESLVGGAQMGGRSVAPSFLHILVALSSVYPSGQSVHSINSRTMPDEQRSTTANTTSARGALTFFATQYTAASPTAIPMVELINRRTAGREGERKTDESRREGASGAGCGELTVIAQTTTTTATRRGGWGFRV